MSIFDFAMQMEHDGEKFYRTLADNAKNQGLKGILNKLADDEVEHYRVFEKLKNNTTLDIASSSILEDSKTIFSEMKIESLQNIGDVEEQKRAYTTALEMEEKSYTFYEDKASHTDNPDEIKLLKAIAIEERRHYRLLEGLIDFISRPEQWIEDAEFVHLTEY